MYNDKSMHICHRHNTTRQLLSSGVVAIDYMRSNDNIADPLTKGLTRELVDLVSKGISSKPMNERFIVKKKPS